ncbi:kynureninase [Sporosarcina koreensis]|uniref:kynureninase n=1 Tax=Sporosarcina koreensis TaxID=334735 RepID=UPI000591252B|nr:kynureninase [Sporosarcina koreensis]
MTTSTLNTPDYAAQLEARYAAASRRDEFYIQDGTIYFDGNSLGLLSKRAESSLLAVLDTWKRHGIDGWTQGERPWFHLSEQIGAMMAPLIGANPSSVIATGSTTSNLHQLLATFFKPADGRTKILADELNFPTDLYAIQSQLRLHGLDPEEHLIRVESRDGQTLKTEDIIETMTDDTAIVILSGVLYRSGQVLDMERITKAAHDRGILAGYDLCHSIGSVPHHLDDWNADFAFWCNYKHLNGGPGATGGLYVNERHFGTAPGLAGWFGSDKERQFDMEHTFTPAADAGALQMGTPHLLSSAPLIGSLELLDEVGIPAIRERSLALTGYLLDLVNTELGDHGFTAASPADAAERGGHVFLVHPEAARICKALKANGLIPDFRAPNGIRLAPVALYNTFEEVRQAVLLLKRIMVEEQYKQFENKRDVVA